MEVRWCFCYLGREGAPDGGFAVRASHEKEEGRGTSQPLPLLLPPSGSTSLQGGGVMGMALWELGLAGPSPWTFPAVLRLPLADVRPQPTMSIGQEKENMGGPFSLDVCAV
jgi:hypothetical protein